MKIPWHAWYGDTEIDLEFPAEWNVTRIGMADAPAADRALLYAGLHSPIGTPPLWEMAKKKKTAVIVVEDITRPSPMAQIIPQVLTELEFGGIRPEDTYLLMALGAHTPMRRSELILKLGEQVVRNYTIYQNHVHENREYLGETQRGTPVYINRFYLEADLRISLGGIVPHGLAGFAGGYKTVAVGVAGIETLATNHARPRTTPGPWAGRITGNDLRNDLEEVGRMARLDFIVNTVVNSRRELVRLFAGDPIHAHRAGVRFARQVYTTKLPPVADVAILNVYPKDTDIAQLINAMNAVGRNFQNGIKPDGSGVMITACSQGAGMHYLDSIGMRGYAPFSREKLGLGKNGLIIFSPNLSRSDIGCFPADTTLFNEWSNVIEELKRRHGDRATVSVFPNAAIQLPDSIIDPDG
jgi:nickel-dependent lactate racemase